MKKTLRISRREYKVMLDQRLFVDRKEAALELCLDLHACAKRLKKIEVDGEFKKVRRREIVFLDTRDQTIKLNRLVFRMRTEQGEKRETEYTLKCRSPDRYVAAGANLKSAKDFPAEKKLEEDIGAPFLVRFSKSHTVVGPHKAPETLADAAELFPVLGKLKRDDRRCSKKLELQPVNSMRAFERVLSGPMIQFEKTPAEVALILWSDRAEGRPLVAEFSFRYENQAEAYEPQAARLAMEFFEEVQRMDWCVPGGRTKTQFAYGTPG
ncbi:hypothetical protein ETAA8_37600 [Anatilimnocola aggregata]|uniref:CYTH domain-containing protein n=1 Tax=Anatilimnocola aggregata TaxID=2528021 RepID=A0A517YEL3_9BACT|nr:hypothetical protein [Anatilimnocola aggregata]QDU28657.1 hypothetical protein ETAA8_37600 [Anatilimnocola aggregata]